MSNEHSKLISIGMPIRNEARFLRAALDALTAQSGVELELIISDNASTDATPAICREYCARFPWISYHRFEENAGAAANFTYVLEHARGDYFMWASGHDLWAPNYLLECSRMLERFPGAVIAAGNTVWIDAGGAPHPRVSGWNDTRGASVAGRYFTVFWGSMNPIIALIRISALKSVKIANMTGGDLAMLLELAILGDFVHTCETQWSRREFRDELTYEKRLERYKGKDFALGTSFWGRVFPLARLPVRIVGDVFRARIGAGTKFQILLVLFPSLLVKYFADRAKRVAGKSAA